MIFIDFDNRGGGGSGGGVTTGQVATMIENKQNLYTATTLSAITSPKEGDVASITTTASSTTWVELTVSQFKNILENNLWGDNPNFKFSVDTSVQSEPWQLGVIYGDYELTWVIGYAENGVGTTPYWYDGGDYSDPNQTYDGEWDGSEITMTFPTPIDDNLAGMAYDTPTGLTILNQQNVTTTALTQYTYVNGQWVETGSGSINTNAVQRYITAATDSAFTGLTGMKEGDIACLISHDVVIPNEYDYDGEGWDVSFYDGEWWRDRRGYDVQLSFDAAQIVSQDVLYNIQQHNIEWETDDKLELIISLLDESNNWLGDLGIAVDGAGTIYEMSEEEGDWVELTGSTYTTIHVPSNVNSVGVNTNNYDFNLSEPDAIYAFRETGTNIHYYRQNGEWVKLDKYATNKYVDDKVGGVQYSVQVINNTLSGYNARITNNTTNINNLSGKTQVRYGAVTTLPTGASEGDVAILSTIDTGSVVTTALSFNDFVSLVDNGGFTPGKTFTFSADTGTSQSRMEIGVMYKISGVKHFFQIGCSNTGQWYNILNATNQNKQNWDGSLINFTVPSDATNIAKYLQAGSDNHAMYISTSTYNTIDVPYAVIGGQWTRMYRNVMISQADYDALSGNTDSNTIYNITGTTN